MKGIYCAETAIGGIFIYRRVTIYDVKEDFNNRTIQA